MHGKNEFVDKTIAKQLAVYFAAAYEPDVASGFILEGSGKGGYVSRYEFYPGVFAGRNAEGEYDVALSFVRKFAKSEDGSVGGPTHECGIDFAFEFGVAIVLIAEKPVDIAIFPGDKTVETHGGVEDNFSHRDGSVERT